MAIYKVSQVLQWRTIIRLQGILRCHNRHCTYLDLISSQADITEFGLLVSIDNRSILALGELDSNVLRAFSAANMFLHSKHSWSVPSLCSSSSLWATANPSPLQDKNSLLAELSARAASLEHKIKTIPVCSGYQCYLFHSRTQCIERAEINNVGVGDDLF